MCVCVCVCVCVCLQTPHIYLRLFQQRTGKVCGERERKKEGGGGGGRQGQRDRQRDRDRQRHTERQRQRDKGVGSVVTACKIRRPSITEKGRPVLAVRETSDLPQTRGYF